ncbi:hypothetical protein [Deinococcus alpinitundrae]|uniref:hypothetical protein n=1 Tax=Deinococcus alpinitundrae TaxID=468913 RepID=UPI00137AC6C6|nr:hypothetical protein [Deinococcus alpinitundrae]
MTAPTLSSPQISASALVTVKLDGATALITIRPGVALAVVRARLANGSYSVALQDVEPDGDDDFDFSK